jgi:hypothetical protein
LKDFPSKRLPGLLDKKTFINRKGKRKMKNKKGLIGIIAVVAVVAVGAFFTIFVLPGLQNSIQTQTICNNGAQFQTGTVNREGYISCSRTNSTGSRAGTFTCAYSQKTENSNNLKRIRRNFLKTRRIFF